MKSDALGGYCILRERVKVKGLKHMSYIQRPTSYVLRLFFLITSYWLLVTSVYAASQVRVNEVASEESSPNKDWVEIYVASGTVDMSSWKLYEQATSIKTFPTASFTYSTGTYIVINFNSTTADETTATGDTNGNGYVDLYTTDSGLTGTSDVITIRNAQGLIIDAVVYSDNSSWTSTQQTAFDLVVTTGQWTGTVAGGSATNFNQSVNLSGGIGSGNSIGRDQYSSDTDNQTTAKNDWYYIKSNQTKGTVNPTVTSCPTGSGYVKGLISEVGPGISSSNGGDFIEIFVTESSNLCSAQLLEGSKVIKTFPSVTTKSGPFGAYIIFHAGTEVSATNPDETDSTGDKDFDGAIDLYSDETSPALDGSGSNNITLKNSDGTIADFISWAVTGDEYTSTLQTQYDAAVSTGKWSPSCTTGNESCYNAGSISWSASTTQSMARKVSSNGNPQDSKPTVAGDWVIGTPNPGKGYSSLIQPKGEMLEVFQSPFSPYGDGKFSEAIVGYKVSAGSVISIEIYDVRGRLVRTLLDNVSITSGETQTVTWDGRDSDSQIVPIGIYVVHIEAQNADGSVEKSSKTVIVGRKL